MHQWRPGSRRSFQLTLRDGRIQGKWRPIESLLLAIGRGALALDRGLVALGVRIARLFRRKPKLLKP
jgi:hypothetical protein